VDSSTLSQVMLKPAAGLQDRAGKVEAAVAEGPSFSNYLEKRTASEAGKKNLLGLEESRGNQADGAIAKEAKNGAQKDDDASSRHAAVVLAMLLADLKEAARFGVDGGGTFSLKSVDSELFPPLAKAMGLGIADMNSFLRQVSEMSGKKELENFFTLLIGRLRELAIDKPVTAAETELPFLQTLLSQMGVPMDQIGSMTEPAVTGDNKLDLAILLEGLKKLSANGTAQLSGWDTQELQSILSDAGLAQDQVKEIFKGLATVTPQDQPITVNLEQLTSMLEKAVQEARQNRPQVDVQAFVSELSAILEQASADGAPHNWTPLVQQSLQAVYEKLQQIVDLSKVSVERRDQTLDRLQYLTERAALFTDTQTEQVPGASGAGDADPAQVAAIMQQSGELPVDGDALLQGNGDDAVPPEAAAAELKILQATNALAASEAAQAAKPLPSTLQQYIYDQLANGVLRGLQNGEHHLVLKLHPPELGEVKVDLVVRHDQLSVSFSMENSRVKQALENNMQQFRDNLEQRGFVLQQCFVSVGDHNSPQDNWQRFENLMQGNDARQTRYVDLPGEMLYQRNADRLTPDSGLSLFV